MGLFDDFIQGKGDASASPAPQGKAAQRRLPQSTTQSGAYAYLLTINSSHDSDQSDTGDPWSIVQDLPLLADDKNYLSGALAVLQLPDAQVHALLSAYREQWERAVKRWTRSHGHDNAGRRAANRWLLSGGIGLIDRKEVDEL